jgi:hypothetical protein
MGLPSASVASSLVSPTINTNVYNSLNSSGSSIFGAGVLGANYSTSSTGTYTYTASNTHEYNLSGNNAFTLGLLTMGAYNNGFTSLTFTVAEGGSALLTKTFTSLSAAQTYFSDDPVSLGDITGPIDLKLTYKLTGAAAEGAGISYVVADAPVTASSEPNTATSVIARAAIDRPINYGAELPDEFAKLNAELSALSAKAVASASTQSVKGRFETLSIARKTTGVMSDAHAANHVR